MSTWDGPPVMNRKMTCLAFGGEARARVVADRRRSRLLSAQHRSQADGAKPAAERLNHCAPRKPVLHGQKISSLVDNNTSAYSAIVLCAR